MWSDFASIGFGDDIEDLVRRTGRLGERLEAEGGAYYVWRPGDGAELWASVDHQQHLLGLNPHFGGGAWMRVRLTARTDERRGAPLEGSFHVWAGEVGEDSDGGLYPFVFDSPGYGLQADLTLPAIREVQLATFARELCAYATEEEFRASRPGFEPNYFVPVGLFGTGEQAEASRARARFAGLVLETALLTNRATELGFRWARVRTLGGEVDVVAAPGQVEGAIIEGGRIGGSFCLSGWVLVP